MLLPRSWVTLTSALTSAPEGSRVPMGARRAVPAAKASGRYRFGEGTFPRIPVTTGKRRKRTSRQRTSSVALWAWFLSCTGYRLMTRPHGLTVPPRLCHRVGVTVRRLRPGTGRRDLRGAADSSGGLCGSRWFRGSSQRHGRSDLVQSPFVALAGRFGRRRYPPTGTDAVIPLGLAEPQPSNLVECVEAVAPGENVERKVPWRLRARCWCLPARSCPRLTPAC